MPDDSLPEPNQWYWVRRRDGSLAPYRFYQLRRERGKLLAEFYVGSFLQTWPLSSIVAAARMPGESRTPRSRDMPRASDEGAFPEPGASQDESASHVPRSTCRRETIDPET